MAQVHFIYHDHCSDGFSVLWVFRETFHNKEFPDWVTLHPHNPNDPLPEISDGAIVYMADISCSRAELEALVERVGFVVILDHHATAIEELGGFQHPRAHLVLDKANCGAVLAWKFFFPRKPVPLFLQYIEDRDLWKWQLPDSREFSAGLDTEKRSLENWNFFCHHEKWIRIFQDRGRIVLGYNEKMIDQIIKTAHLIELDGHRVPAVVTPVLHSEVGEQLWKHYNTPFSIVLRRYNDGHCRKTISLRSATGGFDVGVLAAKYGGGGHQSAAGLENNGLFDDIISQMFFE